MNDIEKKFYKTFGIKPLCQIEDGYCGLKNVYEDITDRILLELICILSVYEQEDADCPYEICCNTIENLKDKVLLDCMWLKRDNCIWSIQAQAKVQSLFKGGE